MDIKITPSKLRGSINAPPSKSYAHRLMIAAFINGRRTFIKCGSLSKDVIATAGALESFGAHTEFADGGIYIEREKLPVGTVTVECGESGSTLRFLMPLAAALGINADFIGSERLMERPIDALAETLKTGGAEISGHSVRGKLRSGNYTVDGSVSSQFVTGMMFALAALGGNNSLAVTGKKASGGYIDVTADVLREFGADITQENGIINLKGRLKCDKTYFVAEGDWSNAAFFLAAGAIGGDVAVNGLNLNSRQGDMEILNVLKKFGAQVYQDKNSVRCVKSKLTGTAVDVDGIPDLAQIISVVAAYSEGKTVLTGVDRLRLKESDRVEAILKTLGAAGVDAAYSGGAITISGGSVRGGVFDGGNDHRTVMSASVLASFADGQSTVTGAEACEKSYPGFFSDFNRLGGKTDG